MTCAPDDPTQRASFFATYFAGRQYAGKQDYLKERDPQGKYVPIRMRAPNVRYNLCRAVCNALVGFLFGRETFPEITSSEVAANPALKWLRDNVLLARGPAALRKACIQGSVAIAFGFRRGKLITRSYARHLAWPIFDDAEELLGLVVLYRAPSSRDGKMRWQRMTLDARMEIWEEADGNLARDAKWEERDRVEHGFGFVPAVWVRHGCEEPGQPDGESLLEEIPPMQEEIDYSLSQRARSLRYCSDPQTYIRDEAPEKTAELLKKSPDGTWLLGKDGAVGYLEMTGKGLELSSSFVQELRRLAMEVARVVLPDPEKISGQGLSGYALRILHEAMIDLGDELKTPWSAAFAEFTAKVLLAAAAHGARGQSVSIPGVAAALPSVKTVEAGSDNIKHAHPWLAEARDWPVPAFVGDALPLTISWGPYFQASVEEEKMVVDMATTAKNGGIISAEGGLRKVAPILDVANVDEELTRIHEEAGLT